MLYLIRLLQVNARSHFQEFSTSDAKSFAHFCTAQFSDIRQISFFVSFLIFSILLGIYCFRISKDMFLLFVSLFLIRFNFDDICRNFAIFEKNFAYIFRRSDILKTILSFA